MAFICPSKEDSERRREVLCKLKTAVDKLVEGEGPVPIKVCPPPCARCCAPCYPPCCMPCCPPPCAPAENTSAICKPPEVMVCYKVRKCTKPNVKEAKSKTKTSNESKVKQSKSRELRAGILYTGCDCERKNGLQDDCRRSECHGSPECLTLPNPTCGPSEFSNGKHLGKKNYRNGPGGAAGSDGDGGKGGNDDGLNEYECYPAVLDISCSCPCTA